MSSTAPKTMTTPASRPVTVRTIESGHAEVWNGNLKRGTVTREKHGSTRTGTAWYAHNLNGKRIGTAHTRADAVALVANAPRF